MRKAAIGAAAVVLVLGLAVVLVPRLVSLESFRPRIVSALEEKTGRKVGLGRIALSLFPGPGVKVRDLSVSGDPRRPGENLLVVPEGEIRLALWPLFSGRAEFTTVILSRPAIVFRRFADGTHSATGIAERMAGPAKAPGAAAPPPSSKLSVAVRNVRIEDARLSLSREEPGGGESTWEIAPLSLRLSGVGGRATGFEVATRVEGAVRGDIELEGTATRGRREDGRPFFKVDGRGELFGQDLTVSGEASAEGETEVDLAVSFPKIDLAKTVGIFREPPAPWAEAKPEGIGSLTVKAGGSLQALGFEAEADLTRAAWTAAAGLRKFIDDPCTIVLQGRYYPDQVLLSNAELRYPPVLLIANASYTPSSGAMEWSASSRISSLEQFSRSRGKVLLPYAPAGRVTASGKGKRARAAEPMAYAVEVDLGDVGLRYPERRLDLRTLNGHVEITPQAVAFQPLGGIFNGQRFSLRGSVSLGPRPAGQIDLRMAYLDVDALFSGGEKKTEGREKGAKEEKGKPAAAPPGKKREVSARATVAIDAGVAKGFEFTNLSGIVRYEKETLFLESVTARIYGGESSLSGEVGLSESSPSFKVKVGLKNVAAEKILAAKTSLSDFISGPVTMTAEIGGGAKDFSDFTRTARGAGKLSIAGGKIKGLDLLSTAAGLAGLGAVAATGAEPGKAARGETAFRDLSADFRIESGKIRTDALRLVSDRLGVAGRLAIGFDRSLEFRGAVQLPREASDRIRGGAGRFLVGPGGRIEIPLVLSGPLTSPAAAIDAESLAKGAASGLLRDLVGKEAPAGGKDSRPPAGTKAEKAVEGLFEKLLRKK